MWDFFKKYFDFEVIKIVDWKRIVGKFQIYFGLNGMIFRSKYDGYFNVSILEVGL